MTIRNTLILFTLGLFQIPIMAQQGDILKSEAIMYEGAGNI